MASRLTRFGSCSAEKGAQSLFSPSNVPPSASDQRTTASPFNCQGPLSTSGASKYFKALICRITEGNVG